MKVISTVQLKQVGALFGSSDIRRCRSHFRDNIEASIHTAQKIIYDFY